MQNGLYMKRASDRVASTAEPVQGQLAILVAKDQVPDEGDRGEKVLQEWAAHQGLRVVNSMVVPDDRELIEEKLVDIVTEFNPDLILTIGGTGISRRDHVPEATLHVIHREVPGIPERLRAEQRHQDPLAVLSRGVAGIRGETMVINLPDSVAAVRRSLATLSDILPAVTDRLKK